MLQQFLYLKTQLLSLVNMSRNRPMVLYLLGFHNFKLLVIITHLYYVFTLSKLDVYAGIMSGFN